MIITDTDIMELVNSLIDLKDKHTGGFTEDQIKWRNHGIELAIIKANGLLGNSRIDETQKYDLNKLKTA